MTEAPYHRITRVEVKLEFIKGEKDKLVICNCPYCEDYIIGVLRPDTMHPYDGPIIKVKTKCEHFEYFTPIMTTGEAYAIFNPPAPF